MGEVHEGICGTHQSALKMKWLLHRAGFYWPTMMAVAFATTKGAKSARSLGIFSLCVLLCSILLSNHSLFVVGG
jgi:hypothetical protein